jgi:hypothetical protein
MLDMLRDFLSRRRQAYARIFNRDNDPLGDRAIVLDDLMKFCRFGESVFDPNQRKTDVLIGRQEVLHRILDHAGLDLETLFEKYNTDKFKPRIKAGASDA